MRCISKIANRQVLPEPDCPKKANLYFLIIVFSCLVIISTFLVLWQVHTIVQPVEMPEDVSFATVCESLSLDECEKGGLLEEECTDEFYERNQQDELLLEE